MNNEVINRYPYIRASREFPEEITQLSFQTNLAYVDIANAVNARTIGLFPVNRPAITGEAYYITGQQKQQSLRQLYTFTTTANIPHNIELPNLYSFSKMYGTYTDGTNWYGLIAGTNIAIAGQITFYVDPINIVFVLGAGAPALTKGTLVLEWIGIR